MQVKTKSGRFIKLPNPKETSQINLGIASDPDTFELSDKEFKQMRPAVEVLHELFSPEIAEEMLRPKSKGRPRTQTPQVFIGIRPDMDILTTFKAMRKGWRNRMK